METWRGPSFPGEHMPRGRGSDSRVPSRRHTLKVDSRRRRTQELGEKCPGNRRVVSSWRTPTVLGQRDPGREPQALRRELGRRDVDTRWDPQDKTVSLRPLSCPPTPVERQGDTAMRRCIEIHFYQNNEAPCVSRIGPRDGPTRVPSTPSNHISALPR